MEESYIKFDEKEIFDFLTKEQIPSIRECFDFLKGFYQIPDSDDLYHHLYSEIMECLTIYTDEQKEQICAKLLETVQDDSLWNNDPKLRRTVTKLYDHTSLEVKRSQQSNLRYEELEKMYASSLAEKSEKLQELIETQQYEIKKQNKKIKSQRKDLENQSKELITRTLTIMSIFTAFVFTAITSFDVVSSIAAAVIGRFGLWGTLIALSGTAIVAIDIFYILLRFICDVIGKDMRISGRTVKTFNVLVGIIILIFIVLEFICPQYVIS